MGDIEFLVSDFKENDKKELREIEKQVKSKPLKNYKETVFLKRFVLAMMKQYYTPKHKDIKDLQHKINVAIPNIQYIIPHIMPKPPGRVDIGSFMPSVPNRLDLFGGVSSPKEEIKMDLYKKISDIPKKISEPHNMEVPRPVGIEVPKPNRQIEVPRPV